MDYENHIQKVNVGDTLYYPICRGMVIPVEVQEVNNRVKLPGNKYVWHYIEEDKESVFFEDKKEELSIIENGLVVLQCVWIDEITGHALEVGEHVFMTLQEALLSASPVSPRQAKRAHKKVQAARKQMTEFVNRSHKKAGLTPSCPEVKKDKPIYKRIFGFRGWSMNKRKEEKLMRSFLRRL